MVTSDGKIGVRYSIVHIMCRVLCAFIPLDIYMFDYMFSKKTKKEMLLEVAAAIV